MTSEMIRKVDHYIVFDLEWNQCPFGKAQENKKIPFEIIEIGAVKLDKEKKVVDKFHSTIRPMVYKKLHFRTKEIIGMDIKALEKGEFFYKVIKKLLTWCGPNPGFATWGATDLIELQRNMKYYGLLDLLEGPIHFFDVQKLFSLQYGDGKTRKALEYAIDQLTIKKDRDFHRALSDAHYTADVLGQIEDEVIIGNYSIDVYQNPKSKEEEILAVFDRYSKYISREFGSKEDAMKDGSVVATKCFKCGKTLRKKVRWFASGSKNYHSALYCPIHGHLKGKIRMKKTEEGNFYVVKTLKLSDENEVAKIHQKRDFLKKKRQEKRREA